MILIGYDYNNTALFKKGNHMDEYKNSSAVYFWEDANEMEGLFWDHSMYWSMFYIVGQGLSFISGMVTAQQSLVRLNRERSVLSAAIAFSTVGSVVYVGTEFYLSCYRFKELPTGRYMDNSHDTSCTSVSDLK